jgi:hypothetical protein
MSISILIKLLFGINLIKKNLINDWNFLYKTGIKTYINIQLNYSDSQKVMDSFPLVTFTRPGEKR